MVEVPWGRTSSFSFILTVSCLGSATRLSSTFLASSAVLYFILQVELLIQKISSILV